MANGREPGLLDKYLLGWRDINGVTLPPDVIYFIDHFGLMDYGLKPHQIRRYLKELAVDHMRKYERDHKIRIQISHKTQLVEVIEIK